MGLDATVWCNCIETEKLNTPHPFPELLIVHESGEPDIDSGDLKKVTAHDKWQSSSPCEHNECVLVSHYLGNTALVAGLRESVGKLSGDVEAEFSVLWSDVIYSGTHCGDFLKAEEVKKLKAEIVNLRSRDFSVLDTKEIQYLQEFLEQIDQLIEASLSVNKPIVF